MSKLEQLSDVLSEWLMKVTSSVLPKVSIQPTSQIGRIMNGFFGIDLSSYNVWNELGFLMKPTIGTFVSPMMNKYLSILPEDKIKKTALEYVDAMIKKAGDNGYVNLFGIQLGRNTFEDLQDMINEKVED